MERLNCGIIGCGAIAEAAHLQNLLSIPEARIVALCDVNENRTKSFAALLGKVETYSDYRSMLSESSVDAVLVCTPASTHCEIVSAAIEEGKHVFVEKPLATTVSDAQKVLSKSRVSNVTTMVGYQLRFLPNHWKVREMMNKGLIGKVYFAHVRAETLVIKTNETILVDYMTHLFDLVRWYFAGSRIRRIAASIYVEESTAIDIGADVTIVFDSGVITSVESFWVPKHSWGWVDRRAEILGEMGKISTELSGPTITIQSGSSRVSRARSPRVIMPSTAFNSHVPMSNIAYKEELEHFVHCVLNGTKPSVGLEDGLIALEVAESAKKSHASGTFVEFPFVS